ncbi:MAG: ecdysteroid 22-kinase family protein [Pseudomonadales bacterium]|nr:ecdysteroid 22-kinase family protein [Pseudomonadales bacterium]
MGRLLESVVNEITGASYSQKESEIQELWSGYGTISRYRLSDAKITHVVIKHVAVPQERNHPRGWNTKRSHARKLQSYQVESNWYKNYSKYCDGSCRVPDCLGVHVKDDEFFIVLDDLDASGYSARRSAASIDDMKLCLKWLANFHAVFMGKVPSGVWPVGTYWHLDTRPDELQVLDDIELKTQAPVIDTMLTDAPYQTFVHGDAKLANFCFSEDSSQVAAVDFQYVGGGCGMKDVAYFIGSCLSEDDCQRFEHRLLDDYFEQLRLAIKTHDIQVDCAAVEASWRPLYYYAWADFQRFLKGWSPGHWKIHGYSERVTQKVLDELLGRH